jgi:hypothetical protein
MTNVEAGRALTPDAFFAGLLAGLASIGQTSLSGTRSDLHRAFYGAVSKCAASIDLKTLEIDYDPLYGVSPWFDRALTRAQRDLLINFPNPTYERIEICYDPEEAKEVLEATGSPKEFVALAEALTASLAQKR